MKIYNSANDNSQSYLPKYFEFSFESFFIFFKYFNIVIQKANCSHPYRGKNQQPDINIVDSGEKQHRNQCCQNNDNSAHRWCTCFLILSFESKLSNGFADLFSTDIIDNPFTENS